MWWVQADEFEELVKLYLASIPPVEGGSSEPKSVFDCTPLQFNFPEGMVQEDVRSAPHSAHHILFLQGLVILATPGAVACMEKSLHHMNHAVLCIFMANIEYPMQGSHDQPPVTGQDCLSSCAGPDQWGGAAVADRDLLAVSGVHPA